MHRQLPFMDQGANSVIVIDEKGSLWKNQTIMFQYSYTELQRRMTDELSPSFSTNFMIALIMERIHLVGTS
jgi:hypothetical protein